MRRRLVALIAPLALYAVAVGWLTWPLGAHLATHLPNTNGACALDTLLIAWVLAWQTHALATAPLHFAQANIYHPAPHALFYCETGVGALPFYAPGFLATGNPALALNLTLLGGVTLTAWTLHLVVRRWTGSYVGGFLAAWTFLTTRWVLWEWGPVAPNYMVLPYLPLIVLLTATPPATLRSAMRNALRRDRLPVEGQLPKLAVAVRQRTASLEAGDLSAAAGMSVPPAFKRTSTVFGATNRPVPMISSASVVL